MAVDTDFLFKRMVDAESSNRTEEAVWYAKELLVAMDDLEPVPQTVAERSRYPNLEYIRDKTRTYCRRIINQSGRGTADSTSGDDCH